MKSASTPARLKILSLLVGIGLTGVLIGIEFPLEEVIALVVPVFGLAADFAVDGLEIVLAPMLLACCALSILVKGD